MQWTLDMFWSTVSVRWECVDETLGKPKKTYAVDSAEMEISNATKKAPHLSRHSFVESHARRNKPTQAGLLIGWKGGVSSVWRRFARSMNRKTWFTPHRAGEAV